jgi:hypothetical protein
MRLYTCCVVLCLSTQLGAQARDGAAVTPEAAAQHSLEALRVGDYLGAARAVHPARLRQTRIRFDTLLRSGQATYIAQRIFQLPDTQALLALDDAAFTAGLFRFGWMLDGEDQRMRKFRGVEIVGSVRQGRDTAHVVYRFTLPSDSLPLQSYNVTTLLRCGTGWCGSMLGDLRSLYRLLAEPMRRVAPP